MRSETAIKMKKPDAFIETATSAVVYSSGIPSVSASSA